MATRELHLELLLGRPVRDPDGAVVGRIEEVRAERDGDDWVIRDYLVGRAALLERLSAPAIGRAIARALGARGSALGGYVIPWDRLDLTDPERPLLRCGRAELATFGTTGRSR